MFETGDVNQGLALKCKARSSCIRDRKELSFNFEVMLYCVLGKKQKEKRKYLIMYRLF